MTTAFCYGTYLGPAELARHMPHQVTARELARAFHQHCGQDRLHAAHTDVINAFAHLDITGLWGDGSVAAADGSHVSTWENNLLAETSIRYGAVGKIAYRHISDTYIALFSRFIPCGVREAVYILDGLLANDSDVQPDAVHADTQGQSLPVFGLAALLGFELLPRIRNWQDLIFYRPEPGVRYRHIDSLFGRPRSTGGCWSSTGRTCCVPPSPSARAGCPRSTCSAGCATTPIRTASTGRSANWAVSFAPWYCCGTCPNLRCVRRSPRSPTGPRASTASPTGSGSAPKAG